MKPLCCLDNRSLPIIVDASVAINLNATGCAPDVIQAVPNDLVMVDIVHNELSNGLCKGRNDANLTARLITDGHLQLVQLHDSGWRCFEELVSGDATETLDDGEAATIAFALENSGIPLVDERKAMRICAERFSTLSLASTVDLFAHPDVQRALGQDALGEAVFNALQRARMHVQAHQIDWVVALIGSDRAAQCKSLPKRVFDSVSLTVRRIEDTS